MVNRRKIAWDSLKGCSGQLNTSGGLWSWILLSPVIVCPLVLYPTSFWPTVRRDSTFSSIFIDPTIFTVTFFRHQIHPVEHFQMIIKPYTDYWLKYIRRLFELSQETPAIVPTLLSYQHVYHDSLCLRWIVFQYCWSAFEQVPIECILSIRTVTIKIKIIQVNGIS